MGKAILFLQRVNFCFFFKIQDNQRITLNNMCWIFDRRSLIFFLKKTSLISFQQLDFE